MANTVYVVTEWYPYDGEELKEVYSTYEEAVKNYPNAWERDRIGRGPFHEIYEKEVIETSISKTEGTDSSTMG